MALVTALAFVLVISTLLGGVATLAVSHYSRSKVEANYALAIQLAEAGINYELRWISQNTADPNRPHQLYPATGQNGPYSGSVTGTAGTFRVYVTNLDGSGPWRAPNDLLIVSTGTVNGISRRVQVKGKRKSLFDEYALYAYIDGTFTGGGSSSGSTAIVGDLGANGAIKFGGTLGSNIVNGNLYLNGSGASGSPSQSIGSNVLKTGDPVVLPTVSQIASTLFPQGGLTYLQTNNNNANIMMVKSTDPGITTIGSTVAGLTLNNINTALANAGFTAASRNFDEPSGNKVPTPTSSLDAAGGGRFATATQGIMGQATYFIPPGDYYFSNINWTSGSGAIVFLTHLGTIRIWVDGGTSNDTLKTIAIFTSNDPSRFRFFYNKVATFALNGSSTFNGGFYAIVSNPDLQHNQPSITISGNTTIYGSVMTDYFTVTGGSQVIFPNTTGNADPTDYSLWFGFKDGWKEIPTVTGGPTFIDGSSN